MLSAIYAYAMAALFLGLSGEAHTPFLRVAGVVAAIWMGVAGSITGWQAARDSD